MEWVCASDPYTPRRGYGACPPGIGARHVSADLVPTLGVPRPHRKSTSSGLRTIDCLHCRRDYWGPRPEPTAVRMVMAHKGHPPSRAIYLVLLPR
jgi:hypothetical protein